MYEYEEKMLATLQNAVHEASRLTGCELYGHDEMMGSTASITVSSDQLVKQMGHAYPSSLLTAFVKVYFRPVDRQIELFQRYDFANGDNKINPNSIIKPTPQEVEAYAAKFGKASGIPPKHHKVKGSYVGTVCIDLENKNSLSEAERSFVTTLMQYVQLGLEIHAA